MIFHPPATYLNASASDKIRVHNYGYLYNLFIFALLHANGNEPLNVLEIGVSVFGRGSMYAFSQMPFIKKYVGIDLYKETDTPKTKDTIFIQGNAYSKEIIDEAESHGPYHLIIDDGDHDHESQINFFRHYRGLCAIPSILFCEDVYALQKVINGCHEKEIWDSSFHVFYPAKERGLRMGGIAKINL